ncbi:MAG: acyl-CoA dehydrogenase [Alcaligenaceae bacterium]|nr:acyl-CoA dehydrogenase [Alcaligenaceae bacterium]
MITTTIGYVLGALALSGGAAVAVPGIRRPLLSKPILKTFKKILPTMSQTERDALESGTVWWEGELFSGRPEWNKLLAYPKPQLTAEEQSFMANQVATVCAMIDDWQISHKDGDLPSHVWDYIKKEGFFGMIIPKSYGGLEFSAYAHSQVVAHLSTRSSALSVTVMVPNSLGPAELLMQYGTEQQKDYYLPRLARGEEIPAFALTSPWAGSDAASIPDYGVVCKGEWEGQEVLGMRVSWDKRYITLAPVCTLIGLAFKLYDPERLLGSEEDIGITCALIPHDHPGMEIGDRHFPLNAAFMNGPTRGKDVFIPMEYIIGGQKMAGKGWRMLMECLAVGRSISLPSSNAGMSVLTARTVGAYSRVRNQFGVAIGQFEGVAEALARIGAYTYVAEAARTMTSGAVDLGEKPAVASGIVKYHITEIGRHIINDGMDVIGGKGICLGPSNFLGRAYQQVPVGITVEGANILTRSLIIFGQGATRCHPYVLAEMEAVREPDNKKALLDFDKAFWGHVRFVFANAFRTLGHGLTGARFAAKPDNADPHTARYYQDLSRVSTIFALLADTSMFVLGGSLKRRESISARLGDILSQMYLASTVLKRYEDEGRQEADLPFVHWAIQDSLYKAQVAIEGVLENFPNRVVAAALRPWIFSLGKPFKKPSDELGLEVAQLLLSPNPSRDRLTENCYLPSSEEDAVGAIELALEATLQAEPIQRKLRELRKGNRLDNNPLANVRDMTEAANELGALTAEEYEILKRFDHLRDIVVRVDDFTKEELFPHQDQANTLEPKQSTEAIAPDSRVA